MKSILISVKPKWVVKILNREKTIEIRKTMPKCDLPIDVYIYCTKSNYFGYISKRYAGKVVAKFILNKVEMIRPIALGSFLKTSTLEHREIIDKSCLTENEIRRYLTNMYGYAWHISNLVIFDKPKELSEFKGCSIGWNNCIPHNCKECPCSKSLAKAPQSWCYVEELL